MLMILHGKLDMLQKDQVEDYLKQLNVYNEIVGIKLQVELELYDLKELGLLRM